MSKHYSVGLFKSVFLFVIIFFCVIHKSSAQYIHYQGAARSDIGTPLANKNISLRISIIDKTPTGTVVYWEVRKLRTNALGLYDFNVGEPGSLLNSGSKGDPFLEIDWSVLPKFISLEIDPNGGNLFTSKIMTSLSSVPYALYAVGGGVSGYNHWKKRPGNQDKSLDDYVNISVGKGLGDNSIESKHIRDGAITHLKLAPNAVGAENIQNESILNEHIANDAQIEVSKFKQGLEGQILQTTPDGVDISNTIHLFGDVVGPVGNNKIADNSVSSDKILNESVSAEKLTAGAGKDSRIGVAAADGKVTYIDLDKAVRRVQKNIQLKDGVNTVVLNKQNDHTDEWQVNVAVARGAMDVNPSTLGVVKEATDHPIIKINNNGELLFDEESLNQIFVKNQDYTLGDFDRVIIGDAAIRDITITLPSPKGHKGRRVTITKNDINEDHYINVVGRIDGVPKGGQIYTAVPHTGWELMSDGDIWRIINKF